MDYGFEKIKRDIMGMGKTWKPLMKETYDITKVGVAYYDNNSDCEQIYSVGLMSGTHAGALRAATTTSEVGLALDEDATQREVEGKFLLITSGTGVDQAAIVDDYNTTSKVCNMADAYPTLPAVSDGYLVVSEIKDLLKITNARFDQYQYPGLPGVPKRYAPIINETSGRIALNPIPDAVYGLRKRYYVDLMKIDTDSTLYLTLLRRWANVFEQGIYVWKCGEDDDRYDSQNAILQQFLANLLVTDLDGYKPQQQQQGA
jgi:hypothetical protein